MKEGKTHEEKDLRIMVCKNQDQLKFYFREMLQRVIDSGREHTTNGRDTIEEKEDRYMFMTPDRPEKLIGLHIAGYDEMGTCYEHPHFTDFVEELERRII